MHVNAAIAEYNPFHTGHAYHLQKSKQVTGSDYTIAIMSGDYVQRGEPAIINKYARTKMALQNGADLVIELPPIFSTASAEYFAKASVACLDQLGVVDTLCFGSECGETQPLQEIADILKEEPAEYQCALKEAIKNGFSYPIARNQALIAYKPALSSYINVLNTPNNILGIEYLKAIKLRGSSIVPHTIMRNGAGYHSLNTTSPYCSALAIRQAILQEGNSLDYSTYLPDNIVNSFLEETKPNNYLSNNDFSSALLYCLLSLSAQGYKEYADVSSDLSDKITKNLYCFSSFDDFCNCLKSKDMTYSRIHRSLLHILLDIQKEDYKAAEELDYIPYARVLGFRKDAAPLLNAIKKNTSIPLLSNLAAAPKLLNNTSYAFLEKHIKQNHIYAGISACKSHTPVKNEYRQQIVIL